MTAPALDEDVTAFEAWTSPWELLLRRVVECVGLDADSEVVRGVAARTDPSGEEHAWASRLVDACVDLGLHAVELHGTVADVARSVGPEHPVVGVDAEGQWVLLTDRRGSQLCVERGGSSEEHWTRRGDVAALIDPTRLGAVRWVAIDPPSALGSGPRGAHGHPPPTPWARLRALVRQERHDVLVIVIYGGGVGLLALTTPIAVQALVNSVAFATLLQPLIVIALLLLAGLAFAGVLRALQVWVVEVLQRRLFVRLVNELSHRLPRVEIAAFDRAHGPELVNRFFDLFTIQKAAATLLVSGLEIVLTTVVGMLVLAFYHPILLAFDVVLVLAVIAILAGLGRGATHTAVLESKAKYKVASWLEEVARHPVAFKLAGGPVLARQRTDELAATYLAYRAKHFGIVFRQIIGSLTLHAVASAGILGLGGWLVIERQLTLGQLVAAELIVTMVVVSFTKVGKQLEATYDLLAALDKVGQLLDLPLEAPPAATSALLASTDGATLRIEGLAFGADDRPPVASGIDLVVRPGQRVVIAGSSGGGKSLLLDVLLGLRKPAAGHVLLDGVDLTDVDRRVLRRRTALVRGSEIVVGTIGDNVTFGRPLEGVAVREALRDVDLLDEIAELPEGLATPVLPDGSPLSRSQAARLVLARAIAGKPDLLCIDGALDALDPETRRTVLDALFAPERRWTLLLVTHDVEAHARASRVFELRDGALTEAPRHGGTR